MPWSYSLDFIYKYIEQRHEISKNVVCAISKASDQPARMRSLTITFASRLNRKFCQRGSHFENVFYKFMRGGMIQIALKAGHHWPTSETPFKWRFAGGPMMALHWVLPGLGSFVILKRIRTRIAKKPYTLVFLKGVRTPCPPPPPGSTHGCHWHCWESHVVAHKVHFTRFHASA